MSQYLLALYKSDDEVIPPERSQQVWAGDRNLAIANSGAMKDLVSSSITQQRFILTLLACFAALGNRE